MTGSRGAARRAKPRTAPERAPLWVYSAAVCVADRRKAAAWYRDVLGFTILDEDPEHWTTVGAPGHGARVHLCEMGISRMRSGRPPVRNTGILLISREPLPRLYRRMSRRGVRFSMPPRELPWGWIAKLLDPDGNEFWLMPAPDA